MKRFKTHKTTKMTITNYVVIVILVVLIISFLLFHYYGEKYTPKIIEVSKDKIEKVTYQFFSDLITNEVINNDTTKNLIKINDSSKNEIVGIDYDMESTYKILTDVSKILKKGLSDFENGKIDVNIYDETLKTNDFGLYLDLPLFIGSDNMFLISLGPKIPIYINFTGSLLTNIKTKVTNYGLYNALLEIYITVLVKEELLTPVTTDFIKINYDILIAAKVVNGRVPYFYGDSMEKNSSLLNTPLDK